MYIFIQFYINSKISITFRSKFNNSFTFDVIRILNFKFRFDQKISVFAFRLFLYRWRFKNFGRRQKEVYFFTRMIGW